MIKIILLQTLCFLVASPVLGQVSANDNCSGAVTIGLSPITGTTAGATQSLPPESCSGFTSGVAKDVWYKFTPSFSDYVTVSVSNTNFDPVLQVYEGNCSSLSNVDCSDTTASGGVEAISFYTNSGSTYYVRVYGYGSSSGTFNIVFCSGTFAAVSSATDFCNNSSITLTGEITGLPYKWYKNNLLIAGQTSNILTTTEPGTYFAQVSTPGCETFSNEINLLEPIEAATIGGTGVYSDDYFGVNIGITNYKASQDYYWRKAGSIVYGPPYGGNGGNQSLNFDMTKDFAGTYLVEAFRAGCVSANSNPVNIYYGGVDSLKLDSVSYNKVGFSWKQYLNPVQRFQYIVSTSDIPPYIAMATTTGNFAVVDNLLDTVQYYIHVRGASFQSVSSPDFFDYSYSWKTLAFKTRAAPRADECANAASIGAVPTLSSNVNASQSMAPATCSGYTAEQAKDIWFKFVPPVNGNARVIVSPTDGSFDAVLQVFSGTCSHLISMGCIDFTVQGQTEELNLTNLTEGNTYYVRVYGWDGTTGNFEVSVCYNSMRLASTATSFCETDEILLTANGPAGVYEWYKDGLIAGSEGFPFYKATANNDGAYFAKLVSGACEIVSNTVNISTVSANAPNVSGGGMYDDNAPVTINVASTIAGQTYTLRKYGDTGSPVSPLNGNGSNQSFNFTMASSAGHGNYYVEAARPGNCPANSTLLSVYYGGVANLTIVNCPYNSVEFSWDYFYFIQRFRYFVSSSPIPDQGGVITEENSAVINNLSPGTQYYLHVSGSSIPNFNTNNIQYSSHWKTLPFTTMTSAAAFCEWTGNSDTLWSNAANWKCGIIPQNGSAVTIPAGRPNYPVVSAATTIKTLNVNSGANIKVNSGVQLNITN